MLVSGSISRGCCGCWLCSSSWGFPISLSPWESESSAVEGTVLFEKTAIFLGAWTYYWSVVFDKARESLFFFSCQQRKNRSLFCGLMLGYSDYKFFTFYFPLVCIGGIHSVWTVNSITLLMESTINTMIRTFLSSINFAKSERHWTARSSTSLTKLDCTSARMLLREIFSWVSFPCVQTSLCVLLFSICY